MIRLVSRRLVAAAVGAAGGTVAILAAQSAQQTPPELYPRSPEISNAIANLGPVTGPPVGITSTGQPRLGTKLRDGTWFACDAEARRIADLENHRRFRDLLRGAAAANVAFYPVEPVGVGSPLRLTQQLESLASESNGTALVNSIDLSGRMKRMADGLSSYYLLGYSSTNTTFDGRLRRINVTVAKPDIDVKARWGYRAPTEAEIAALRRAAFEFQRSERLRNEWPALAPIDRREARILDRAGTPLPVSVLAEVHSAGGPALAVDVALAPLAAGDYVVELIASAGDTSERKLLAFRIGR
jgi:hypothetical protein